MTSSQEFGPNERLQRARSLKGWSQAELAEQVGTSFEIVSRWERGITIPSSYYRQRLCAVLGQNAEELGLLGNSPDVWTSLPSPFMFLASSHVDTDKPIISHLKTALQERGIALLSSRQLSRQGNGNARTSLREFVQVAQVILVIISPAAASSRHVREAMEWAGRYQRPVCGVWIEGEHWQEYLPKGSGEVAALLDARTSDDPALIEELATSLQLVGWSAHENGRPTFVDAEGQGDGSEHATASQEFQIVSPPLQHNRQPATAATQVPADVPLLPPRKRQRSGPSRGRTWMLIGLVVLVIAGTLLSSVSLLVHFGVLGAHSTPPAVIPVRGGTWIDGMFDDLDSLIPNGSTEIITQYVDHALYLPLFYGDAQGVIHPGAAREIPTLQNGGVNANATTWTFRLRRGLVWSDGQPYDARDVDYTWRLWVNPPFSFSWLPIRSAVVSPDNLSITFHLKQPYVPFLNAWADGSQAPLPAHHFRAMAPDQILKSPDNLNPTVTSGPFMISESIPGDHYTVVRNPRYYLATKGLPYLDRVVFRVVSPGTLFKDMQSGSIDSVWLQNVPYQAYQHLSGYSVVTSPTSARFEFILFNFHNTVLATHLEVRQAIAYAIDQQALIQKVRPGFATPLCTNHPSAQHPGYDPNAPCPQFNREAANKLLDFNGWVKGPDGVRTRKGQRLEFEYSAPIGAAQYWRNDAEMFVQESLKEIGIKLDIQNYPYPQIFSFLATAKASPPTGAVAGRFDIYEKGEYLGYDPDDSYLLACDQLLPAGENYGSYCNRALDALYQQELATQDPGQRQQIFHQIHTIYLTDYPIVVLFSLAESWVVHKGTNNYLPSPINGETGNIWEWWCDSGKC